MGPVVNRKERTSHLDWITEHWDRIGQFFAALIRSSLGISSGKLANLANSVSEKIDADTDVSSDWFEGFRVVV